MIDSFIKISLHLLTQVRYWHWQTDSYPVHQALGAFYDGLDEAVDQIAETTMSDEGRVNVEVDGTITATVFANLESVEQVRDAIHEYLEVVTDTHSQAEDRSDVQNLLDELKALSSKTLYLLTLE